MRKKSWTVGILLWLFCACYFSGFALALTYGYISDLSIPEFNRNNFVIKYDIYLYNATTNHRLYIIRPWKEAKLGEGYTNVTSYGSAFRVETELDNNTVFEVFPNLTVNSTFYWATTFIIVDGKKRVSMETDYEAEITVKEIDEQTFREVLEQMHWNGSSMIYRSTYQVDCVVQRNQEIVDNFLRIRQVHEIWPIVFAIIFVVFMGLVLQTQDSNIARLSPSLIASTGQFLAHSPHLVHSSVIL